MIDIDDALERVKTRAVNYDRVARGGPFVEMNLASRDEHQERLSSPTEVTRTAELSMDATTNGHGPATVTMPTDFFAGHGPSSVGPTVLSAAPGLPVTVFVTAMHSTIGRWLREIKWT